MEEVMFQLGKDEEQDPLLNSFSQLKETLQRTSDFSDLDSNIFLGPFLEVIRSEDTTGPITGVALSSINKFLSYGLIDPSSESASSGIDNLADAVTHARFVGTDPSSDEVVLMKILQVLRTLLLSPVGVHMTNESVCEIMQSCFRICFEMRLSELLRRTAEQTLIDMVQLLFLRLPQFKEDIKGVFASPHIRKMFKRTGPLASTKRGGKRNKRNKERTPTMSKKDLSNTPKESEENQTDSPSEKAEVKSDSEELVIVKQILDQVEALSCDDIDLDNSAIIKKMVPVETTECLSQNQGQPANKIGNIVNEDNAKMSSIDQEDNQDSIIQNRDAYTDGNCASKEDQLNPPDSNLLPESDQDDQKCDNSLSTFQDHGVISLHYPEDDARSLDSFEVEMNTDISQEKNSNNDEEKLELKSSTEKSQSKNENNGEYVNPQGVRFTAVETAKEGHGPMVPYGLPCVRELLRFLTTLINPQDRHNTNTMIHIGLSLLTVALESGATHIAHFSSLMQLIKDDVCRNIFALLQCDIHILFALSMRVSFLLFEALRGSLMYQLEYFFTKLMSILSLENLSVPYEKREMALEYVNQEVYVNFDCDLHSANVLEDLCKSLSKNAFRPGKLSSVNLLALDTLLTVINEIESHCHQPKHAKNTLEVESLNNERTLSSSSEITVEDESGGEDIEDVHHTGLSTSGYAVGKRLLGMGLGGINKEKIDEARKNNVIVKDEAQQKSTPTFEEIVSQKKRKKLLIQGIDEFNKKPKKGIEFLQEAGLLSMPLVPAELVYYMKENPKFDKKIIGDYIGDRKNAKVLEAFVSSFNLVNVRIDEALRSFLETFRLPGESPVIAHILEEFTARYFEGNPAPYKNTDAAFTMAYAVIMLNVDQHNKNVKQQKSMTVEEFKKNLRQTNDGEDFPAELLEEIYDNIRNNEIVMPSERTGKVKDMYDWKVLTKAPADILCIDKSKIGERIPGYSNCLFPPFCVLIRKCMKDPNPFVHVTSSRYDEELFLVVWGPTVAALSYVYDNSNDKANIQKTMQGFRKCATISAFYNLSEVFDNILISLCKFTSLLVTGEPNENLPVLFGSNVKSQLSARTVFALAHKQGDILREGWQNLIVCILQLLKAKLLPLALTEVEDFVEPSGKISLIKEDTPTVSKPDNTGVFAAFYSYMLANPDTSNKSTLTSEEKDAQETALNCIKECHPENIINESKFLRSDSLMELVKALIIASKPEHSYESTDVPYDEDASVFFLEFLIKIALQNRDRICLLWQLLREHLSNIIISAPKVSNLDKDLDSFIPIVEAIQEVLQCFQAGPLENLSSFLVERAVVGLLRLANRLIRRDDISAQVLITLRILLMMHPKVLLSCSKQISYGLHELIRTNASDIQYSRDWITILTLLQTVGAGASPPIVKPGPCLTLISGDLYSETGESLSQELTEEENVETNEEAISNTQEGEQWLLINKNEDEDIPVNQYDLTFKEKLNKHDSKVFIKASSSIAFIIRDMAHVKDFNIFQCIYAILLFGEASSNGGLKHRLKDLEPEIKPVQKKTKTKTKRINSPIMERKRAPILDSPRSEDEAEINENTGNIYDAVSLQLLDLMYALHTNSSKILAGMTWSTFSDHQKAEIKARWSSRDSIDQLPSTFKGDYDSEMTLLWVKCWCPLLQGIARFCCDTRRETRMVALTILQRALLAEDLQSMNATEWENCFNQVLFPMLASLLELPADVDPFGLEETRMRASTLLCKAFLQHLNTLMSLSTFTALWMTILDFMDKYMHADNSDLLLEAIPESLKNMLLVMSTAGIFEHKVDGHESQEGQAQPLHLKGDSKSRQYSALWQVTWDRIDCFLPNLKSDLMATQSPVTLRATSPPEPDVPGAMTIHTEEEIAVKDVHKPLRDDLNQNDAIDGSPPTIPLSEYVASHQGPTTPANSPISQRAASPLLSDEPPSLNITLHTPLPHISPPGSAHAIRDNQQVHPIPILLPPMSSLTGLTPSHSPKGVQGSPEHTILQMSPTVEKKECSQETSTTEPLVDRTNDPAKVASNIIHDI